jgi:hypothetical protein
VDSNSAFYHHLLEFSIYPDRRLLLASSGFAEAITQHSEALRLDPGYAAARTGRT